jgi:quercetin dioxygenase-like cupin family protein
MIIKEHEGDAFWHPSIKGDCVTIKLSPWNNSATQHTVFLHELPKGGTVGEHAHDNGIEIFICLEGEAILTINGKGHSFQKHDIAYIPAHYNHSILSVSDTPLKFMVVTHPTGLEERLKLMGIPKKSKDEIPPESFHSEIGKQCTHGVIDNSC